MIPRTLYLNNHQRIKYQWGIMFCPVMLFPGNLLVLMKMLVYFLQDG